MKKAYQVEVDTDFGYAEIVFAENVNEAKILAMGSDAYDDIPYTKLRPKRVYEADVLLKSNPNLERASTANSEHARLMRSLGWKWEDGDACSVCGLSEYDSVPESYLDEDGVCEECRNESK